MRKLENVKVCPECKGELMVDTDHQEPLFVEAFNVFLMCKNCNEVWSYYLEAELFKIVEGE